MKNKLTALIAMMILLLSLMATATAAEAEDLPIPDADRYGAEIVLADGRVAFVDASYTDVADPEDLLPEQTTSQRRKLKLRAAATSPYETADILDAGAYLRENFKNRTGTVKFQIPCENESDLDTIREQCWAAAFIHTGIGDEGDYLRKNMQGYSGYQNWANGIASFELTPTYYTTLEQEQAVTAEVDRLMAQFAFTDETTDYEKVRAIYDHLCRNVVYDESPDDGTMERFTSYGALVKNSAVCQGYASSFYRLALESGLNARYVSGYAIPDPKNYPEQKENHGWNIVEVDGNWYYLDSTWDATNLQTGLAYAYLLKGTKAGEFPHTAGKDSKGNAVDLPEEWSLLSVESYALPFDILRMPEDLTVSWGEKAIFRVAAIGEDISYKWSVTYGNGQTGSSNRYYANFGTVTVSNRTLLNGATLSCEVTDNTTGTKVTTPTVTLTVVDPVAEVKGYTTSLNGEIAVNFYMELADEVLNSNTAHMHFTIPGEVVRTLDVPLSQAEPKTFTIDGEDVTYYRFTAGVAAKDMTQPIHAQFYYNNSYKMDDQYYTVKEYADYIQDHPESYNDKAISLVQAMLNYGGYAQENFDYHTEEMANADLEDTSLPEVELPDSFACKVTDQSGGADYTAARLVLRSNTVIRLYFRLEGDAGEYTFTADGNTVTPVASDSGENEYYIEITDVSAGKLRHPYRVIVTEGSGDTLEVDYSAYSNIKAVVENPQSYETTEVNMLKALYVFGEAAREYLLQFRN